MSQRMTWEEIQEKYPDQWVGLIDVEWYPDNAATVKTAIVKYTDKPKDELTIMMLNGEIDARYTTPDNLFSFNISIPDNESFIRNLKIIDKNGRLHVLCNCDDMKGMD